MNIDTAFLLGAISGEKVAIEDLINIKRTKNSSLFTINSHELGHAHALPQTKTRAFLYPSPSGLLKYTKRAQNKAEPMVLELLD